MANIKDKNFKKKRGLVSTIRIVRGERKATMHDQNFMKKRKANIKDNNSRKKKEG